MTIAISEKLCEIDGKRVGTVAGFRRHKNRGDDPCLPCLEAARHSWRESRRRWAHRNPEGAQAIRDRWRQRNPDWKAEYQARTNEKRGATFSTLRKKAPQIVLRDGSWDCHYCGVDVRDNFQIDHVHPICKADTYPGEHISELANLVICCGPCNRSKGQWLLEEWAERPNYRHLSPLTNERNNDD